MKIFSIIFISFLLMLFVFISKASANDSEKWFLMARHGECAKIESLRRKIPGIGDIQDPLSFIMFMEGRGHKVIAKDLFSNEKEGLQGIAFQVNISDMGLDLLFVTGAMCKEFIDR